MLWIWRNFRIDIPEAWEMLQYSLNANKGRCAFADRYHIRLEFSWKAVESEPDIERSMLDYLTKLKQDNKMEDANRIKVSSWQGIEGRIKGLFSSRFIRFFAKESCVVQMVFLWPDCKDKKLEKGVLTSIREEPVTRGRFRRWKAFGMDLLAASELKLKSCKIEPANANMIFGGRESSALEEQFRRLGMVSCWLRGSVRDWLRIQTPDKITVESQSSSEIWGHSVETVYGTRPARGLSRFFGKHNYYQASAWICPSDGRLYCSMIHTKLPPKDQAEAGARRLSCCKRFSLKPVIR